MAWGQHGNIKGTARGQHRDRDSLAGHLQDLLDGAVARGHEGLGVLGHPDGLQPLRDGAERDALGAAGAGQADGHPGEVDGKMMQKWKEAKKRAQKREVGKMT